MPSYNGQGASGVTKSKQDCLLGLYHMQATRLKKWNGRVYFFDLFSGAGKNHISNGDLTHTTVDGSPIALLEALKKTAAGFNGNPMYHPHIVFNDLNKDRAMQLPMNIIRWQMQQEMQPNKASVSLPLKSGDLWKVSMAYENSSASDMLRSIIGYMKSEIGIYSVIYIDPNGPKDVPFDLLASMFKDQMLKNHMTVLINISANALKRVAGAKAAGKQQFMDMPENIDSVISLMTDNPKGWIRMPEGNDQWTMLMLTEWAPHSAWEKQGFHLFASAEGKALVTQLSVTKKQLEQQIAAEVAAMQAGLFDEYCVLETHSGD